MDFKEYFTEEYYSQYRDYFKNKEEFINNFDSGEVKISMPDVLAFFDKWANNNPTLPSRFKIFDEVELDFLEAGKISNCYILKVHFSESKVLYDVSVLVQTIPLTPEEIEKTRDGKTVFPSRNYRTRLYNIDSCFVKPHQPETNTTTIVADYDFNNVTTDLMNHGKGKSY